MVAIGFNSAGGDHNSLAGKQTSGLEHDVTNVSAGMVEDHVIDGSQLFIVHAVNVRSAQIVNAFKFVITKNAVVRHSCSFFECRLLLKMRRRNLVRLEIGSCWAAELASRL